MIETVDAPCVSACDPVVQAGLSGSGLVPAAHSAEAAGEEAVHPAGLVHLHERHLRALLLARLSVRNDTDYAA